MTKLLAALHLDSPDSLKRMIAAAVGGLVTLGINPVLSSHGLPTISDTGLASFVAVVASYLLQSGANSVAAKLAAAKTAGDTAAAKVITVTDAAAVLAK